ncbi:MAG: tetratricopeptide repeat protein [Planctomycetota bacterium]
MRVSLILLALGAATFAQDDATDVATRFAVQERNAFLHYNRQEWDQAVAAFETQIAIFAGNPAPYYNIACCYGRQGKAARAATWLRLSIANGWRDLRHLEKDGDFAKVRGHAAYRAVVQHLAAVRRADPDPLPSPVAASASRPSESARMILATSGLAERALGADGALLMDHQVRRRLFVVLDRRMGRLTRYLAENGDASDAAVAAHARTATAMRYLLEADERGEADHGLRRASAALVLSTVEEFLRGWAGSPRTADVLYYRGYALRVLGAHDRAARQLLDVIEDEPDSAAAGRARVELCLAYREPARVKAAYATLERASPAFIRPQRARLAEARLVAKGLPAAAQAVAAKSTGHTLFVFVAADDPDSEAQLAVARDLAGYLGRDVLRVVVVPAGAPDETWLKEHTEGLDLAVRESTDLARAMWLPRIPWTVLAKGDQVVEFDPARKDLLLLK